jgi:hypothetical protein
MSSLSSQHAPLDVFSLSSTAGNGVDDFDNNNHHAYVIPSSMHAGRLLPSSTAGTHLASPSPKGAARRKKKPVKTTTAHTTFSPTPFHEW